MSTTHRSLINAGHVGWAIDQWVVAPNTAGFLAKMYVQMGVRDPREAMRSALATLRLEQLYCFFMLFTGGFAVIFCVLGAGTLSEMAHGGAPNESPVIYAGLLVVSLLWLWALRVLHGWVLRVWTRKLPVKLYLYQWYWPVTLKSGLRLVNLPEVIGDPSRTRLDRGITSVGTVAWFLFVKVPLYVGLFFTGWYLYSALLP